MTKTLTIFTQNGRNNPKSHSAELSDLYPMEHYPNAFSSVKTRFIDGDDDRAQNLLRKCATQGDPTYIVTLASNSKALKSK